MGKITILAISVIWGGCISKITYIIKSDADTVTPAVKKAADYTVFIYAKNAAGQYEYSASGFVVDAALGIIATVRHNIPKNPNFRLYALFKEGGKIKIYRVLRWFNLTDTDAAIFVIRHKFSGAISLRFTPPKMNEKFFYAGYPYVHWHEVPYNVQKVVTHGYFQKFEMYKEKRFHDVIGLAHLPIMFGSSGAPVLDTDGRAIGIIAFQKQKESYGYTFTGYVATRHITTLLDFYKNMLFLKQLPPLL